MEKEEKSEESEDEMQKIMKLEKLGFLKITDKGFLLTEKGKRSILKVLKEETEQ